jgi:hypothetical protein
VRRALIALPILATLALPLFALAADPWVHDSDDTKGRLDIRRVDFAGDKKPRWTVITWRRWHSRNIFDKGYILVRLDTFGGTRFDYYALVRSVGHRLKAGLFRDPRHHHDTRLSGLKVWRPGGHSLKVRLRLSKLHFGEPRTYYRWAVETIFTNHNCPRTCFDTAPGRGAVKEPRPGITPAPTPSPTPSLTPTPTPSI